MTGVVEDPKRIDPPEPAESTGEAKEGRQPSSSSLSPLLLGALALFLAVAYVPELANQSVTPRLPFLWSAAGFGLVFLVRLVVRWDRAAWWLAGFLGWALLSSLASGSPFQSLIPALDANGQWLLLVAYGALWALGRSYANPAAQKYVTWGLVVGAMANAALAVVQASAGGGQGLLDFTHGRSMGFMGNPVYLGGLMAGALVMAAVLALRGGNRWWLWLGPVAAFASGNNLSGSRVALVGSVLLVGLALVQGRDRKRAAAVVGAIVLGVALSSTMIPEAGGSRVASTTAEGGGVTARTESWKAGLEALRERPVLGWGPDRYMAATTPRTSLSLARAENPKTVYGDAHNVVVHHLVTTGVVGLALLGGFAWMACRRARGPLAWFAAGMAVTWLLEPVTVGTGALALLALGLATTREVTESEGLPVVSKSRTTASVVLRRTSVPPSKGWLAVGVVVSVAGLAGSMVYVAADHHFYKAGQSDLQEIQEARRWLSRSPDLADAETQILMLKAMTSGDSADRAAALAAAEETVSIEPAHYYYWYRLGAIQEMFAPGSGTEKEALVRQSYLESHRLSPWAPMPLEALHDLAVRTDDEAEAAKWADRLCQIDLCPGDKDTASS